MVKSLCEICNKEYINISIHTKSKKHLNNIKKKEEVNLEVNSEAKEDVNLKAKKTDNEEVFNLLQTLINKDDEINELKNTLFIKDNEIDELKNLLLYQESIIEKFNSINENEINQYKQELEQEIYKNNSISNIKFLNIFNSIPLRIINNEYIYDIIKCNNCTKILTINNKQKINNTYYCLNCNK